MSGNKEDIKIVESLRDLGGGKDFEVFRAKVTAVNDDDTIDVDDDGAKYEGVSLRSVIDGKDGFVIYPKAGSYVLVAKVKKSQQIIMIQCGDVDKIKSNCEFEFNGGDNGGMVKVKELTDKINGLEKDLNLLKNIFSTWVVVPKDGGSALYVLSKTWAKNPITTTQQTEIENKKVKH